jgi:hypothetical protein
MMDAGYEMLDTRYGIGDTGYGIRRREVDLSNLSLAKKNSWELSGVVTFTGPTTLPFFPTFISHIS